MIRGYKHTELAAVAVLIGTAVGAGLFGIPYVFAQAGITIGVINIVLIGGLVALTLTAYAQVVTRSHDIHQFLGYAKEYFGKSGQWLAIGSLIFGLYSALIAYTIEIGHLLYEVFNPWIGGSEQAYGITFWAAASLIITIGLLFIARLEELIVAGLLVSVGVLALLTVPKLSFTNLPTASLRSILLPYGVILFAFGAASIIPELRRLLAASQKLTSFPKVIWVSVLITGLLYLTFALLVVGVSGPETSENAIDGLKLLLGDKIVVAGAAIGILAMGSSFLVIGLALKQLYQYDFKLSRTIAILLTILPALFVYLAGLVSFVQVLNIAGAVTGGFQGVLIWEMYQRSKTNPNPPAFKFNFHVVGVRLFQAAYLIGVVYAVLYTVNQFV
ncbi:MAG: hypothetical protein COW24_01515 [Candidatus Kerfeldbacteria bacterium CG15_BIG_FIL_POST_REV_8_21_14_020_45_12]|uniref:Aromatic amino acid permease n=1 Tax=Candidatus Kerfeldbacteria bacterium CG15_BIG_FIL_POST_REV_8_21_14_020_45_12 TaxID=2014247 RepID=A0A2M7H4Q2_9BACT|nr:MAG: hypothetical protein COW24_01515 [Candidatus Kerfeldbacteria bacterium CG15_BIG_FIL_POST_REV_8_21_14_020_45_12]PJA93591.1 MAG: hypothetical protein CO132_02300 [Candidatus Kerfeldbacteria bacterium CG_4_9_14_3_um_filter_45_8]